MALALLALLAVAPPARGQQASVVVDGVPRQVPVVERQGRRFVALESVAALLGGEVEENGSEEAALVVDEIHLVVRRRIPFVETGGRWYQLTESAQKDATGFYLPASSLELLFPHLWPGRFGSPPPGPSGRRPERPSGTAGLDESPGIAFWAEPGRTRLSLTAARTPGIEVDASAPRTLRLTLTGVDLAARAAAGLHGIGLVDSARVAQAGGATELTLWLDPAARVYAIAPLRRPVGVEVVLLDVAPDAAAALLEAEMGLPRARGGDLARGSGITRELPDGLELAGGEGRAAASVEPASAETPAARGRETRTPARGPKSGAWIVVVDPGHGGRDPGALGPDGSREKDVTLAVALALREALAQREGIRVILTRSKDAFVPLRRRARIANEARADIFVSVHANSATRPTAEGFETYFLSAAVTEDARRVAQRENASLRYEDPEIDPASLDEVNFILWDLAQNEHLRESSVLAETIQEGLGRGIPLKSRGVKQAPLFVLKGAFMPAILFETGFISNPREEDLLNDTAFQSRLAEGLAASLVAYLDRYGRKVGAATAAR